MNKFIIVLLVLVIAAGGVWAYKQNVANGTAAVADLVSFVNRAQALVESKGEQAFSDFRDRNGEWIKGDSYIFVYDMSGKTLVLPLQKEVEGTSRIAVADSNGERYVKTMVDILKTKKYGWNSYSYFRPETGANADKLSYFKKAVFSGKEYIVGSGIYLGE